MTKEPKTKIRGKKALSTNRKKKAENLGGLGVNPFLASPEKPNPGRLS